MVVMLIDDDRSVLEALSGMLQRADFHVRPFSNPGTALAQLAPDVDLVLSDVDMPTIDGFSVADGVALRLGVCPPRTLLMSGLDCMSRLAGYSPSVVIGLLSKPIRVEDIRRVLGFLSETRDCCPGVKASLCSFVAPHAPGNGPHAPCLCRTARYARCPRYDAVCGQTLRLWISQREHGVTTGDGLPAPDMCARSVT